MTWCLAGSLCSGRDREPAGLLASRRADLGELL